jgi:hypothetical protein
VKEVADSLEVEWINGRNVISPCFIFHVKTIQRGTFSCREMERLFFIRFQKTWNGKLLPISEKNWIPFYRDARYPNIESYPEYLWTNLVTLKEEVQRVMRRGGQWDG